MVSRAGATSGFYRTTFFPRYVGIWLCFCRIAEAGTVVAGKYGNFSVRIDNSVAWWDPILIASFISVDYTSDNLLICPLGTPTTKSWPDLEELPCSSTFSFTPQPENHLKQKFLKLSDDGINLLRGLLTYDPKQRLSAEQCLQSRYFLNEPLCKSKCVIKSFVLISKEFVWIFSMW